MVGGLRNDSLIIRKKAVVRGLECSLRTGLGFLQVLFYGVIDPEMEMCKQINRSGIHSVLLRARPVRMDSSIIA